MKLRNKILFLFFLPCVVFFGSNIEETKEYIIASPDLPVEWIILGNQQISLDEISRMSNLDQRSVQALEELGFRDGHQQSFKTPDGLASLVIEAYKRPVDAISRLELVKSVFDHLIEQPGFSLQQYTLCGVQGFLSQTEAEGEVKLCTISFIQERIYFGISALSRTSAEQLAQLICQKISQINSSELQPAKTYVEIYIDNPTPDPHYVNTHIDSNNVGAMDIAAGETNLFFGKYEIKPGKHVISISWPDAASGRQRKNEQQYEIKPGNNTLKLAVLKSDVPVVEKALPQKKPKRPATTSEPHPAITEIQLHNLDDDRLSLSYFIDEKQNIVEIPAGETKTIPVTLAPGFHTLHLAWSDDDSQKPELNRFIWENAASGNPEEKIMLGWRSDAGDNMKISIKIPAHLPLSVPVRVSNTDNSLLNVKLKIDHKQRTLLAIPPYTEKHSFGKYDLPPGEHDFVISWMDPDTGETYTDNILDLWIDKNTAPKGVALWIPKNLPAPAWAKIFINNQDDDPAQISFFIDETISAVSTLKAGSSADLGEFPLEPGEHVFHLTWIDSDTGLRYSTDKLQYTFVPGQKKTIKLSSVQHLPEKPYSLTLPEVIYLDRFTETTAAIGITNNRNIATVCKLALVINDSRIAQFDVLSVQENAINEAFELAAGEQIFFKFKAKATADSGETAFTCKLYEKEGEILDSKSITVKISAPRKIKWDMAPLLDKPFVVLGIGVLGIASDQIIDEYNRKHTGSFSGTGYTLLHFDATPSLSWAHVARYDFYKAKGKFGIASELKALDLINDWIYYLKRLPKALGLLGVLKTRMSSLAAMTDVSNIKTRDLVFLTKNLRDLYKQEPADSKIFDPHISLLDKMVAAVELVGKPVRTAATAFNEKIYLGVKKAAVYYLEMGILLSTLRTQAWALHELAEKIKRQPEADEEDLRRFFARAEWFVELKLLEAELEYSKAVANWSDQERNWAERYSDEYFEIFTKAFTGIDVSQVAEKGLEAARFNLEKSQVDHAVAVKTLVQLKAAALGRE